MIFENESTQVRIDLDHGARVASLRVQGLELLVTESTDPLGWGAYAMVPWTGRLREGRFRYKGQDIQLPLSLPPHAIHGTVHNLRWEQDGAHRVRSELGASWPFKGEVIQEFRLEEDAFCLRLEVHASEESFPAALGWHPWFVRKLARGAPAQLLFSKKAFRRAKRRTSLKGLGMIVLLACAQPLRSSGLAHLG
jgi:aldose 1-epimerase